MTSRCFRKSFAQESCPSSRVVVPHIGKSFLEDDFSDFRKDSRNYYDADQGAARDSVGWKRFRAKIKIVPRAIFFFRVTHLSKRNVDRASPSERRSSIPLSPGRSILRQRNVSTSNSPGRAARRLTNLLALRSSRCARPVKNGMHSIHLVIRARSRRNINVARETSGRGRLRIRFFLPSRRGMSRAVVVGVTHRPPCWRRRDDDDDGKEDDENENEEE